MEQWGTEGQVNQMKLLKRQGHGRAEFPCLRQRVLHAGEQRPSDWFTKSAEEPACHGDVWMLAHVQT